MFNKLLFKRRQRLLASAFSILAFIAAFEFLTPSAQAYLSIAESAEVLPSNDYQVGVEPQFLLNHGGGVNADLFFDAPINESTSTRVTLGAGAVDFNAFASVKFVPFPDVDNQPAIGVRVGAGVARDKDKNILLAQIAPLISKKTDTTWGLFIPYVAVPVELINTKDENFTSTQFVFGSEFVHPDVKSARFGAEIGLEMNRSYSYVSVFVTMPFDSSKGFSF